MPISTALNSRQIADLIYLRTGCDYGFRDIYLRLVRRTDGFCPVRPMATAATRANGVVIAVEDYTRFEAWLLNRDLADVPEVTAAELDEISKPLDRAANYRDGVLGKAAQLAHAAARVAA